MSEDSIQDRITGWYNTIATGYDAHKGNVPARDTEEFGAWVRTVANLLPAPPSDVLDIATGTGFVALIAADLGHSVTGIDFARPMIAEGVKSAERLGLKVKFLHDDAVHPNFAERSFDAVISRHLLWTLRDPNTALASWRRLLRPGGRVVVIDGFWFSPEDVEKPDGGFFESFFTRDTKKQLPGWQFFETGPIVTLFKGVGFSNVSVQQLDEIHRMALDPSSSQPPFAIVGFA
jgi:ubiquinone/menaquinone biosynthesis C-methylase UbiE